MCPNNGEIKLPAFGVIFNVRTNAVDGAIDSVQKLGLYGQRKRVCTGSCLWEKKKRKKKEEKKEEKIPRRTGESKPSQYCTWHFDPTPASYLLLSRFALLPKADHLAVTQCIFPLKAIAYSYRSCRCAEMQCGIFHLIMQLLFRRCV